MALAKEKKKLTEKQEGDLEVLKRHVRRRSGVEWRSDEPTVGTVQIMNWVWTVEVSVVTVEKGHDEPEDEVDKYQVAMTLRVPSESVDRGYIVRSGEVYGAVHQYVSLFSLIQLIERNDLKQDDF